MYTVTLLSTRMRGATDAVMKNLPHGDHSTSTEHSDLHTAGKISARSAEQQRITANDDHEATDRWKPYEATPGREASR